MSEGERPRIQLPLTKLDRVLQIVAFAGAVTLVALVIGGERLLPERVPLHFNAHGEADRWGSPRQLVILAVLALGLYLLLTVVARVPHLYNYPWAITQQNAARQYELARRLILALRALLVWLFVALLLGTARVATGAADGLGAWFLLATIVATGVPVAAYLVVAARER